MNSVILRQYGEHDNLRDAMAEAWNSDEDAIGLCCRVALQAAEYAKQDGKDATQEICERVSGLWALDGRDRAIRAVVAAQFADAVVWSIVSSHYEETSRLLADSVHRFGLMAQASALGWQGREMASLPTAEEVVDGDA